ncbi:PilN domain-containing protein [Xanthobacter agilis]|uniref:PilN domain-containing protein n=1 Tax=Xanthobacter agilis TaxID=47492 RepID=UPI003728FBAE
MTVTRFMDLFSLWLDMVASTVSDGLARVRRRRGFRLTERENGLFSLTLPEGGAVAVRLGDPDGPDVPRVIAARLKNQPMDLHLDNRRMLARPLDLPHGAAPFLPGIVRSQIDRLTPWMAEDALYGWTPPDGRADDRIRITVVATPKAAVTPLLAGLRRLGAGSISITTTVDTVPIRLLDQSAGADPARIRTVLMGILGAAALLATAALVVSTFAAQSLDAERADIEQAIAATRRQIMAARANQGTGGTALEALEQRKHDLPAATLTLEHLSRVLPDNTYVTDLQIDGDRVRIAGVSAAPAELIRLMEQSGRFTGATFVAPTTPLPTGHGERFDIEAAATRGGEARP